MPVKLEKKIVDCAVKSNVVIPLTPLTEREESLSGATYKIKPPTSDHAIYVTINDHNGKPYEIFVNTKCPTHHSWLSAVTRLISAIFRTGQDCSFVIDELKAVKDPSGGYFYPKMGYVDSVQAHIGIILERHINGR